MTDIEMAKQEEAEEASQRPERCTCNKLLCIIKGDNIEIRCNKCKRHTTIYTKGIIKIDCF